MKITEIKKDLFDFKADVYVHCISLDCEMGAGIAKQFVRYFPYMKAALIEFVKYNNCTVPTSLAYRYNGNTVVNLITKEHYWDKPTYKTLEGALIGLRKYCIKHDINTVAMPYIGCGLDKLSWDKVKPMIEETFKDTNIDITVCSIK